MKNYELTYLASPELSEQDIKNLSEKINKFIQEETGTIEKTTQSSKKKLGYSIKRKEGAFLISLDFFLDPDKLKNLEKKLKAENQILRYTILIKRAPRKASIIRKFLPKKEKPFIIPKKATETKKVELKEIDKKIEEILNE